MAIFQYNPSQVSTRISLPLILLEQRWWKWCRQLELRDMQSSSQLITTNKPKPSFLQAGCPSCHSYKSVKALKEKSITFHKFVECDTSGSPGGLPTLFRPLKAAGGCLPSLLSALWHQYPQKADEKVTKTTKCKCKSWMMVHYQLWYLALLCLIMQSIDYWSICIYVRHESLMLL